MDEMELQLVRPSGEVINSRFSNTGREEEEETKGEDRLLTTPPMPPAGSARLPQTPVMQQ